MRARLVCDCGWTWFCGLQEAIDACNVVRAANGQEPVPFGVVAPPSPMDVPVPAPSLPMEVTRRHAGFASSVGALAHRWKANPSDFKARQSGERQPGEDDV
jgi:hypothetical protein